MKYRSFLFLFILFNMCLYQLNAQGIIDGNTDNENSLNTSAQQLNYFIQQFNETNQINVDNTGVFIHQIGDGNTSSITTQSQVTDVQVNQLGNANTVDLNLKADEIDYTVTQKGNNNLLLEHSAQSGKQLLQRTIQQNGNNQNLVIQGRNSIVDKMKITMNNGSQSIIIRNTN
ncbi:hypothetical protein J8L85_12990 [Maribacter sp. MMG018]|uniref:hypothetical protein n=1 Tax=Maribacter sp. MMG018 TaxID=2822688 RepID=UPI001B397427|nr:hypothetical protein [Maribacter sp. MMG018]MBQ4915362.1 hypothetical protein [Maribacter sp. MMG018]